MAKKNKIGLTAHQVKNAGLGKVHPVDVPEWGGVVYIGELSVDKMAEISSPMFSAGETEDAGASVRAMAELVAACLCDENGQLLFPEGGAEELSKKNFTVIKRLSDKAMEIHGLTESSREEMEKN